MYMQLYIFTMSTASLCFSLLFSSLSEYFKIFKFSTGSNHKKNVALTKVGIEKHPNACGSDST